MKVLFALFFVVLTAEGIANATPINNSTTEVPETVQTVAEVVQPPVNVAPTPIPEPVVEPEQTPKAKPAVISKPVTGSKEEWLRLAEIPESEWGYVDYIVSKESGWNPCAYNPGKSDCNAQPTSACGLAQALPCSKLGTNWSDPVHALKWQYNYVKGRYGGYAQAYNFWKINHWY